MNLLDLLILLMSASALFGGWRLGFLARATSWIGLAVGFTLSVHFLPDLVEASEGFDPNGRLLLAAFVLIGGSFLGQALGLVVGAYFHHALPVGPARTFDRSAGAALGLTGVFLAAWLLLPSIARVQGWPAREATTSRFARAMSAWAPDPPDVADALARLIDNQVGPDVFERLRRSPDAGPAPVATALDPALAEQVALSTVRIEGTACDRRQSGSGFVVAPNVVVTNAHVVAGEDEVFTVTDSGSRDRAVVAVFDPNRDLAVLRVPGLDRGPLPIGEADLGEQAAVFGYPGGGDLQPAPAELRDRITATGTDIYSSGTTRRDVVILAARLAPGYSGGAVVDTGGTVVGVAFAIARDRSETAYALHPTELRAVLALDRSGEVDTGDCLT